MKLPDLANLSLSEIGAKKKQRKNEALMRGGLKTAWSRFDSAIRKKELNGPDGENMKTQTLEQFALAKEKVNLELLGHLLPNLIDMRKAIELYGDPSTVNLLVKALKGEELGLGIPAPTIPERKWRARLIIRVLFSTTGTEEYAGEGFDEMHRTYVEAFKEAGFTEYTLTPEDDAYDPTDNFYDLLKPDPYFNKFSPFTSIPRGKS